MRSTKYHTTNMKNFLTLLASLVLALTTVAQCELGPSFDYTTPNNGFISANAMDNVEINCPDADSLTFEWRINGQYLASGVSIENAFIGNYSGLVNFCCIVRAYQDGVVFQASDACVELDLDPCFIQGVLVPTVQNANELVFVMDGVNGGTAPYIYTWYFNNGESITTTSQQFIWVSPVYPAVVSVEVVDANGCVGVFSAVAQGPQVECDFTFTYTLNNNQVTITEFLGGEPIPVGLSTGVNYYVNGQYQTNVHNPSFYLPNTGTFEVCGTFWAGNCQDSYCQGVVVEQVNTNCEAFFVYEEYGYNYYFTSQSGGFVNGYSWVIDGEEMGMGATLYMGLEPGAHEVSLTVTNSVTGCSDTYSQTIEVPEPILICGYAFEDVNLNGIMDDGEQGIEYVSIYEQSGLDSAVTDVNGYYELLVHPGSNTVQGWSGSTGYAFVNGIEDIWHQQTFDFVDDGECNYNWPMEPYVATLCGIAFLDANNNGLYEENEMPLMNAAISVGQWNANQEQTWEILGYSNENGEYCINIPAGYNNFQASYVTGSGATIEVVLTNFGWLEPGTSVTANAPFYFVEDAIEVELTISSWNNATPGFQGTYQVMLANNGTLPSISDVVVYFPLTQTINFIGELNGVAGTYNPATNSVIWVGVNLDGLANVYANVSIVNATNTILGSTVVISGNVTVSNGTDVVPTNNAYNFTQVVVGSYDPNNKLNNPPGEGEQGQMLPTNEAFTYTVNFQNTGTAPAFTVRVEDELDADLDWSSFEMIQASHDYYVEIINGKLIWTFNNIMLPDSTTDEPNSHGHIVYRIKPIADKPVGTVFENTAYIYFDFNEPIITNTTVNTFVTTINIDENEMGMLSVYPNPATDQVTIVSELLDGNAFIRLLDVQGRVILNQQTTAKNRIQLPVQFESGQYILQIQNGVKIQVSKLLVK